MPQWTPFPATAPAAGSLPAATAGNLAVSELGGNPAYLPVPVNTHATDDVPIIGRQWATRFLSAEEDAVMFAFGPWWQRATDAAGTTLMRLQNTTVTGDVSSTVNPTQITNVSAVADGGPAIQGGEQITGTGIPSNTTILSYSAGVITMDKSATITNAGVTLTINREVPESTILTLAKDLRDWEVLVKYMPKSSTAVASAYARNYGGYAGPSNYWRSNKRYHTTAGAMSETIEAMANGAAVSATYTNSGDTAMNIPRFTRVRKVGDAMFYKTWYAWLKSRGAWSSASTYAVGDRVQWNDGGGIGPVHNQQYVAVNPVGPSATNPSLDTANWKRCEEPDWQYIRRFRSPSGATSFSSTADNSDIGQCGFGQTRITGDVYELTVIELLRRPEVGLLANPTLKYTESLDQVPLYWSRNAVPAAGNTLDIVDVMLPGDDIGNPMSVARKAMHLKHTVTGASAEGNFWAQSIYNARHQGINGFGARVRRHPMRDFAPRYLITCWSKGLNIVNQKVGGSLCAALDIYYYSREGAAVNPVDNVGRGTYWWDISPAGPYGPGTGTWDWHFFAVTFTLQVPENVGQINPQFGFHDPSSGELWIADPRMIPIG